MATEYIDGTFSETLELERAKQVFEEALEARTAKAFHIGTFGEIENVKESVSSEEKLEELSAKVKELESDKRGIIERPTHRQIETFGGKNVLRESIAKANSAIDFDCKQ